MSWKKFHTSDALPSIIVAADQRPLIAALPDAKLVAHTGIQDQLRHRSELVRDRSAATVRLVPKTTAATASGHKRRGAGARIRSAADRRWASAMVDVRESTDTVGTTS